MRTGLRQLAGTIRHLGHYRQIATFLVARMLYYDGLAAIFAFGGIYAAGSFGWTTTGLGVFGILLTVVAGIGAAVGGVLDDRLGSRRTVLMGLVLLFLGTLGVVSVATEPLGDGRRLDTVLFLIRYEVAQPAAGSLFATPTEFVFLAFGMLVGLAGGPVQAASRSLMARLAPPDMVAEFFGLYALSGKATAFMAPWAIAVVTGLAASQRAGVAVVLVFLAAGTLLLLRVAEPATTTGRVSKEELEA